MFCSLIAQMWSCSSALEVPLLNCFTVHAWSDQVFWCCHKFINWCEKVSLCSSLIFTMGRVLHKCQLSDSETLEHFQMTISLFLWIMSFSPFKSWLFYLTLTINPFWMMILVTMSLDFKLSDKATMFPLYEHCCWNITLSLLFSVPLLELYLKNDCNLKKNKCWCWPT